MHFSQSNDRLEKTYRSFIQTGGMTIVAAAIVLAAAPILSGGCKTMESTNLQTKATRMLAELDTIESATKAVVLMEIDEAGKCTMYERIRFLNGGDEAFDSFSLTGGFEGLHLYTVGGEEAEIEFGDFLPNGIERQHTVSLRQPVPPGGWLDYVMVAGVTKYKASEFEEGLWRFGPVEGEMGFGQMDCLFAVRLPRGAHVTDVEPDPDDIRGAPADTIIWQEALSAGEEIALLVEYRLQKTE